MTKPIIGVIPLWDDEKQSLWMLPGYFDGICAAGGLPVMLPLNADESGLDSLYRLCDGLLFTGGHDVNPELYGQRPLPQCGTPCPARDHMEERLFRRAFADGKPIFGICRGIQLINVLMGGTLYQDLPTEHPGPIDHHMTPPYDRVCHTVRLAADGPLFQLLGMEELGVNSYHHQAVRKLARCLAPMAWSSDGLVEAAYCPKQKFLWAVQWHPEFSYRADPAGLSIFRAFIRSCVG